MRKAVAIAFLGAAAASCLAPVLERQCERDADCGSGYRCIAATCMPGDDEGDGGKAGGAAGASGGTGGSAGSKAGGGGTAGAGGSGGAGGGAVLCSPANCLSGCCNFTTNTCIPTANQSTTTCGFAGRQCLACPANDTCRDGTCVGPAACDFDTCPNGCCANGLCVPTSTQSVNSCGLGGGQCRSCGAGNVCNNGTCQSVPTCNAGSCPNGCCNGNTCVPFTMQSTGVCGTAGQACRACLANQTCVTGSCGSTLCNPGNCPNGCCQGNVCVQPQSQSAVNCGKGGAACVVCAAGQTCSSGACVAQGCGPQTCMGCCSLGSCTRGMDVFACGTGGQACVACPAGSSCVNGTCQGCSPTTCPNGCCQFGFCQPGNLGSACGAMGGQCQTCPAGTMCQMQRCVPVTPPVAVGSPCTTDPDCASLGMGAICKRFTSTFNAAYLGGYCTLRCGPGQACPTGSSCGGAPAVGENDNICLQNCSSANGCRMPGYACYSFGALGFNACWIFPTPTLGDAGTPPPVDAGVGRAVGAACTADSQCQPPGNAFCLPPTFAGFNTGYLGGYCSRDCSATSACPAGSLCISESLGPGGTFMTCKTICSTPGLGQGTCRPNYVCQPNAAGAGWCGPRCNNSSVPCPNGTMCNNSTGYCQ